MREINVSLARSLFEESRAYGILEQPARKYGPAFVDDFVNREEVISEAEGFLKRMKTLFYAAVREQNGAKGDPAPASEPPAVTAARVLTPEQLENLDYEPVTLPELTNKAELMEPAGAPRRDPAGATGAHSVVAPAPTESSEEAASSTAKEPALPLAGSAEPAAPAGPPPVAPASTSASTAAVSQRPAAAEQMKTSFTISSNGKVNIPLRAKLEGKSASGKEVDIVAVTVPEDLGLAFDRASGELIGTPLRSGEFKLAVSYKFDRSLLSDPLLEGECALIVNHDPKSLWKNEASDQADPFWKQDEDSAFCPGSDGFCMVAASKRGRSHAHVGSFRDDDFRILGDAGSGWRVLTVADGAGSAKKSRRGSYLASKVASDHVLEALLEEKGKLLDQAVAVWETDRAGAGKEIQSQLYYLFGHAAKKAVQAIESEASAAGSPYKDFSTTLVMAIHKKIPAGHFIAAYWVGDGGAAVYRHGAEVKVLGKADSGQFAGQTRFLDSAMLESQEIMGRIRITIVPDFTALVVMTDGITDAWFETDANIEKSAKWEELWSELRPTTEAAEPGRALLEWLDFWSAGNHDDRTIAMLYPRKSASTEEVEA